MNFRTVCAGLGLAALLLAATAWALVAFVLGGLFFISREREFAVRL